LFLKDVGAEKVTDVLWILKEDHDRVRKALDDLKRHQNNPEKATATATKAVRECMKLVMLEETYLLPELDGVFPNSKVAIEEAATGQAAVKRQMKGLSGLLGESAKKVVATKIGLTSEKFIQTAVRHLDYMEQGFLPKVRQFMPTSTREDLGQVIMDAKEEMTGKLAARVPAPRRKLA